MDPPRLGGDMSPLYVPRKRKSVHSQSKGAVLCPVVQRLPERIGGPSADAHRKDDESQSPDVLKTKTDGRKRFEDVPSLSTGSLGFPTTSCSVTLSGRLANGAAPGSMAPPTARPPPRLVSKEAWPQSPETNREPPQNQSWNSSRERIPDSWTTGREQEQVWNSTRVRGTRVTQVQTWITDRDRTHGDPDQTWMTCRDQGPEQNWSVTADRVQDQAWNVTSVPGRVETSSGSEQTWDAGRSQNQTWCHSSRDVWRPDVNMKKVQGVGIEQRLPVNSTAHPPEGAHSCSSGSGVHGNMEASTSRCSDALKSQMFSTKKEPPSYPPGSPEERWQLQIVARGRVTCPKCKSVSRKTVEGLKKHMENCRLQPFTCQHCGKQLKSSTGMKYHIMADHSQVPSAEDAKNLDDRATKDKLRKILKRLGKLKCSKEGCNAAFTSIMGFVYHMRKCGKEESELEKLLLNCSHCGKAYKSRAGLEYHLKSEHAPTPQTSEEDEALKAQGDASPERTASGRVQRLSAQVANFQMAEIANNDLPKDWPKRKFQSDLVPDDKKLKYSRPGLPAFSQEVLRKWKNEVKLQRKVHCPNQGCGCTYTSVSGLKAHLGLCTRGEFEAGKYRCLICSKEFNSESGVKYHINSVHSQEWFVTNKKACKKFEKFLKNQTKEIVHNMDKQFVEQYHQHHHLQHHQHHYHYHHQQQLQHQILQQPLQPLHHLQHQPQLLHMEPQNLPPQVDDHLHQPPVVQYTPLEAPVGPIWVDMDQKEVVPGPEQAPIEMDLNAIDKDDEHSGELLEEKHREARDKLMETENAEGRHKDSFGFGSSSGGSNIGSSSNGSEVDQLDRRRSSNGI